MGSQSVETKEIGLQPLCWGVQEYTEALNMCPNWLLGIFVIATLARTVGKYMMRGPLKP